MKAVITKSDVDSKKLGKIARALSRNLRKESNISHHQILEALSKALGFDTLKDLYDHALEYDGPLYLRMTSYRIYSIGMAVGKGLEDVKADLFTLISGSLSHPELFDKVFDSLNLQRLQFYSDKEKLPSVSDSYISEVLSAYLRLSVESKSIYDIDNDDFEQTYCRSHDSDLVGLLSNKHGDHDWEHDEYVDRVLYDVTINELLSSKVSRSINGRTISGTYEDLVFNGTHDEIFNMAMLEHANRIGKQGAIEKQIYDAASVSVKEAFLDICGDSSTISLFTIQKSHEGFYQNNTIYPKISSWEHERIPSKELTFDLYTTEIEDGSSASPLRGRRWRAEIRDDLGRLLSYASGGLYGYSVDASNDGCFQFPCLDDCEDGREEVLLESISKPFITFPEEMCWQDYEKIIDADDYNGFMPGTEFILTISSWEKGGMASPGAATTLLNAALDKFTSDFSVSQIFALAAPMQYSHWLEKFYYPPAASIRGDDLESIYSYLDEVFSSRDNVSLIYPRIRG